MNAVTDHQEPVLIIGAGAAGISAARYFQARQIPFRVIEASHRVGGRAYSEAYKNGGWFDLGCSYLHEGEINPLVPFARDLGFDLGHGDRFSTENWYMQQDAGGVSTEVLSGYQAFDEALHNKMTAYHGGREGDVSIADLMDFTSVYAPIHVHLLAGLNASDADVQSVVDHLNVVEGKDYPVYEGLGRLVKTMAGDIPVELNCAAEKIIFDSNSVRVETTKGTINASKVIITVSVGILQSGKIAFDPILPEAYVDALHQLKCGTLNKIGVSLNPEAVVDLDDGWHVNFPGTASADADDLASIDVIKGQHTQAVVFAGGSFGEYLEKQGAAAMLDYTDRCLVDLFGSDITKHVEDRITTAWHTEPLTLGSYSYALPGGSDARAFLSRPLHEQLYFAGEAISIHHFGTCHGAYLSGMRAAESCLKPLS